MLTSTVCEPVEDVAFMAQALEASSRVDTEMVAGAVKGALVDVCVERDTHTFRKTAPITKKWHISPAVLFCISCLL